MQPLTWARLGLTDPNNNPNRYFDYSFTGMPPTFFNATRINDTSRWLRVRASDGSLDVSYPY